MIPQNFIRHKVRPDDTLTSLARRINISENDLKEFHNQNCGKMNKLWVTNLRGIEVVLIPTRFITEEEYLVQQHKMLPTESYFANFHLNEYSIEECFEQPGKENLKFNYTINLNIQKKNENFVVNIDLKNFTKNGNIPDDKISSLSLECMKSLYPISFQFSDNGIIDSCFEHQKVVEKFKSKRNDIEDFYIGEISKKYLDTFAQNISDGDYFLQQIQSNWMYQIIFPNLKWLHHKSFWKEKFIIYKNSFPIEFEFKNENQYEDIYRTQTILTGKILENYSLRELLKGIQIEDEDPENFIEAEIEIRYFTDRISQQLMEVKFSVSIWFQNELFQKHNIHITQNNDENLPHKT